jgi:hypothetical protein
MKEDTYKEIEKIVVKGAKDDYLTFEVGCLLLGVLFILALFSLTSNLAALVITATGLIVFVVVYIPLDLVMQAKVRARKELMEEVKKDVK